MTAEGKKRYYLRVEGVNLKHFLFDTQDLSTIRGGTKPTAEQMERGHR